MGGLGPISGTLGAGSSLDMGAGPSTSGDIKSQMTFGSFGGDMNMGSGISDKTLMIAGIAGVIGLIVWLKLK